MYLTTLCLYCEHVCLYFLQESKGYEFESETDTETIAKLVKYLYDNRENDDITFATLVEQVTQQLVSSSLTILLIMKKKLTNENNEVKNVYSTLGRSFCPGFQKCALSRRGSSHQVTSAWYNQLHYPQNKYGF